MRRTVRGQLSLCQEQGSSQVAGAMALPIVTPVLATRFGKVYLHIAD